MDLVNGEHMATVRTTGLDRLQQKLAKRFSDFALWKFFPRAHSTFSIKIKGIDNLLLKHEMYADCTYEYADTYPRDFLIRIDNTLNPEMFIKTLAHEITHVKQWGKGEMKTYERNYKITRWHKDKIKHEEVLYYDMPWEIEAHGREFGLYAQFIEMNEDMREIIDGTATDYKLQRHTQMVLF